MSEGYQALTEKEKQTLRLIVRGHDAKSTARQLGLSVHTINERLRGARRKLSVSSSREAARRLLAREGGGPDFLVDDELGEAGAAARVPDHDAPEGDAVNSRAAWAIKGVAVMSLILATLALATLQESHAPSAELTQAAPAEDAAPAADTEVVRSAREWLELVGADDWAGSYETTARSFQENNTLEVWSSVSTKVRNDLGEVRSRTFLSQDSVPAPPAGYEMVKFRTSFANRPEAIETLTLVREGQEWRVAGYYIE